MKCCGMEDYSEWDGKIDNGKEVKKLVVSEKIKVKEYWWMKECEYIFENGWINRMEFVVGKSDIKLENEKILIDLLKMLGVMFECYLDK